MIYRAVKTDRVGSTTSRRFKLSFTSRCRHCFFHGTEDPYIPLQHSMRILTAVAGPKKLVRLAGVGHIDIMRHKEAWNEIELFILDVANSTPP